MFLGIFKRFPSFQCLQKLLSKFLKLFLVSQGFSMFFKGFSRFLKICAGFHFSFCFTGLMARILLTDNIYKVMKKRKKNLQHTFVLVVIQTFMTLFPKCLLWVWLFSPLDWQLILITVHNSSVQPGLSFVNETSLIFRGPPWTWTLLCKRAVGKTDWL